jgi:two-component system, chemotaxis family, chemotaxis protein CheY
VKLLIVDDSQVMRRLIQRSVPNCEVRAAADGREALRIFREFQPDVVTMDLTMPEMDGLQCIARMTAEAPHARILVVTALSDKSTAVEAVKRGAEGFLLKPFTAAQLNEKIAFVLDDSEVYA